MKQWIALLFCAVLLVTMACPVWAEPEETTTAIVETTTEPSVETTTEPSVETTTEPTDPTTTVEPTRYAVFLTIAYENGEIVIRAKDANNQPVRNAPVKVAADSEQFSGHTNDSGVAVFAMAEEPAQIICSTEAFKGSILYYEAATASVILHTRPTATEPTTTGPVSTTQKPTYITGTSVTWTTSDPLQGNVTVTEIITSSTVEDEKEEEEEEELQPAPQKSALPEGWALALMIMGGVLLLVAAVVLCLFLFRAPRVPAKEEEEAPAVAPAPAPVAVPVKEPEETVEQEADEESAEQPVESTEEPADTAPKSVSLEDLFR